MKRIAVCVLTYNRKNILKRTIDAILCQKEFEKADLLIVDNHSEDGTYEMIQTYLKRNDFFYENTGFNLGGAGGFKYLIKKAVTMGYQRLWIMDDDCIPQENALSELLLVDRELKGKFGWLSSLAYWKDGTLCRLNEHDYRLGKRIRDFSNHITFAITASYVSLYLSSDVVYDLGLPIEEFYMWTDDWEYTRRISRKYPCYVVPKSKVLHETAHNNGMSIVNDSKDRIWRYQYAYRNEVFVLKKDGIQGLLHWFLKLAYYSVKIVFQSPDEKLKKLKLMYSAAWSGWFFHPEIEYIRKE